MKNILVSSTKSPIIDQGLDKLDFDFADFKFNQKKIQKLCDKYNYVKCILVFENKCKKKRGKENE
ncbi:MAG: hypothetical protein WC389_03650 [Lutibacter sp.]|jgi:hypothetical protein